MDFRVHRWSCARSMRLEFWAVAEAVGAVVALLRNCHLNARKDSIFLRFSQDGVEASSKSTTAKLNEHEKSHWQLLAEWWREKKWDNKVTYKNRELNLYRLQDLKSFLQSRVMDLSNTLLHQVDSLIYRLKHSSPINSLWLGCVTEPNWSHNWWWFL